MQVQSDTYTHTYLYIFQSVHSKNNLQTAHSVTGMAEKMWAHPQSLELSLEHRTASVKGILFKL